MRNYKYYGGGIRENLVFFFYPLHLFDLKKMNDTKHSLYKTSRYK